nr:E3 ubiquitin-protein ligase RBBP6-like [Danio rerio]|eukprot:XP_009302615.2 E3 ubiquitin-protein ligase RBBP6-like [Danio rerio]
MSCVHYRFQSRLTYDSLQFEGLNISAGELKRQIMRSKRLKFCQLKISNAQTDEEYTDDALIPKNTSVIIRRIPAAGLKSSNRRFVGHQAGRWREPSPRADPSLLSLEQLLKTENLAEAKASEEDKLKAVMYQSSLCSTPAGAAAPRCTSASGRAQGFPAASCWRWTTQTERES